MSVLEADIERAFLRVLIPYGLTVLKLNLQGRRGWPDRMVLLPGGRVVFVELKRPGKKLQPLQQHVHHILHETGHKVRTFTNGDAAGCWVLDVMMKRV